ncbi:MAG: trehalase family glycosidase [Spirochaetota bacterium]
MDTLRERVAPVLSYIREEWESTVRSVGHDAHPRLYLPHEFTTPCAVDQFQELYYWDTYFTHLGLLRDGRVHLAQSNVLNMFYMIRKFGFVLNSNAVWHLNRSQPPYLSMMVREVFDRTGDRGWLRAAYEPLRSEYDFWMTRRMTDVGLNRYLHDATDHDLHEFYDGALAKRLGLPPADDETVKEVSYHYVAEAESGHDFTPRFHGRCADFAPIDLNSNLYEYERNFAEFSRILDNGEDGFWNERGEERLALIRRYCWDGTVGAFNDYDCAEDAPSGVVNAAMFWPLAYGLATPAEAEATVRLLSYVEGPHGVSTCADTPEARRFQWGFPNAWPPIQVMVCKGLARYGFNDDATRIARKYIETVTTRFEADGYLWEKYDSLTGALGEAEYEANRMLGWTAGVFVYLAEFLGLR